ncbi:hypothetical protein MJO28_007943 [Puccinia striiformis f. sp. tritici]|uniref:Uncharacterized protein n=1 Tax=Puccinia striiformis f. sp. tritici TaxID=168172 RepID=A0ACC0EBA7_9BASI|nr:hypothetical protein MJO28_007943 [Puccinia striiformis f. sp. tritici]
MVVGCITHYVFDLVLISTVLAGIKRNTGYSVKLEELPEATATKTSEEFIKPNVHCNSYALMVFKVEAHKFITA